jgi:nucleoside-diphosphate-sugar epimerase
VTAIFITGADGFIGRAMRRLGQAGAAEVVPLRRTEEPDAIARRLGERDGAVLLHLAWPDLQGSASGAGAAVGGEGGWRSFVDWSVGLREACARAGAPFIGVGSGVEAYVRPDSDPDPDPGSGLGEPYLSYAGRKTDLRQALSAAGPISWVRLHFLFGPGEAARRIVPSAIRASLDGTAFVCGDRDRRRHWLHVDDLAAGLASFAATPQTGVWDLAGGQALSFDELFALVERATGRPLILATAEKATADGRLKLIAPSNPAPNLHAQAGCPGNLLDRLTEYVQWIRADGSQR